ncbi:MAG: sigma-70 family RNA polymerase sigma factor [Thiotrichaceae bacterium]
MEDNYNELLIRCASPHRDQNAFKQLYESTSPRLYSLALGLLKNKGLAEEILQESFFKIWSSADSYHQSKGRAITWMATVTRNKALDKLRSLKVRPQETETVYEGIEFAAADLEPDNLTTVDQGLKQLMDCLDDLQTEQKECILMSYYHGYTHQELAVKMDKPLGTVKAWIRRGLEKIRVCLE